MLCLPNHSKLNLMDSSDFHLGLPTVLMVHTLIAAPLLFVSVLCIDTLSKHPSTLLIIIVGQLLLAIHWMLMVALF